MMMNKAFQNILKCEFKCFLYLNKEIGSKRKIEIVKQKYIKRQKTKFYEKLKSNKYKIHDLENNFSFNINCLSENDYLIDVNLKNNQNNIRIDCIEITKKASNNLITCIPILIVERNKVKKEDKLLLSYQCNELNKTQYISSKIGKIIYGEKLRSVRINSDNFEKECKKILHNIKRIVNKKVTPIIKFNEHCPFCEYQKYCLEKAQKNDSLCLLKNLSIKEIKTLNSKGIFTVNQLSYTFRLRRRKVRQRKETKKFYPALKALAIRENKIYVYGIPNIPIKKINIYFDVEGDPNRNLHYLFGLVIDNGKKIIKKSFWMNNENNYEVITIKLINEISKYRSFSLFHYGSYEKKFLIQLTKNIEPAYVNKIKKILNNSYNILSEIYANVYFPTYDNSLKEIAKCLNFEWTHKNLNGIKSIYIRKEWEHNQDKISKTKLLDYNLDDCIALKILTEFLSNLENNKIVKSKMFGNIDITNNFDNIIADTYRRNSIFKRERFYIKDFEQINKCAYFNYQKQSIRTKTDKKSKQLIQKKDRYKVTIQRKKSLILLLNKKTRQLSIKQTAQCMT